MPEPKTTLDPCDINVRGFTPEEIALLSDNPERLEFDNRKKEAV